MTERNQNSMKRILMIGTGGTIASNSTEKGLAPKLSSEELLNYVPNISNLCHIETIQLCNLDSTNISPRVWIDLTNTIKDNYDKYDGFVITHGTDTMAYTAAALSYMIQKSAKPIVLTGAQKPIHMDVTDSKANLYDSFLYASSDITAGVQIVFNGKVILGTRARKTHTKSYQAFSSINYPYLGTIQDGRILQYIHQDYLPKPIIYNKLNTRVGIFKLIPSIEDDVLEYILRQYDAVVIESYGVGGIPSSPECNYYRIIQDNIHKGKTIVMTTQVPNEGSDLNVYKVGNTLKSKVSIIESYDMILEAVVCKLMWILGQTSNPEEIRKLFYTNISNDIMY